MYLGLNEPECFSSFVGQKRIIENIRISVEASKLRNEPLDHILLYGDEGLGKTTLAKTIAKEMGVDYKILNPQIQSASMLVAELSSMKNKDILLFEDIHKLKPDIIDILVSVMKNNSCTITIGRSITAKKITLELSPITVIGTAISLIQIPREMLQLFENTYHLEDYSIEELAFLIQLIADSDKVRITREAAMILANRSNATPIIAKRNYRKARDFALVRGNGQITESIAVETMKLMD